eukprot:360505-Chlamydomonas_euryale.AAC.1
MSSSRVAARCSSAEMADVTAGSIGSTAGSPPPPLPAFPLASLAFLSLALGSVDAAEGSTAARATATAPSSVRSAAATAGALFASDATQEGTGSAFLLFSSTSSLRAAGTSPDSRSGGCMEGEGAKGGRG